jgi:hypothetical protein
VFVGKRSDDDINVGRKQILVSIRHEALDVVSVAGDGPWMVVSEQPSPPVGEERPEGIGATKDRGNRSCSLHALELREL